MNESDRAILKRYHQRLADDIIVDEELLAGLYTEGVFEKGMIGTIRAQSTTTDKIQHLLELMPKRGPEALTRFIKVIEPAYSWLANTLKSARKTEDKKDKQPTNDNGGYLTRRRLSNSAPNPNAYKIDPDIKQIASSFIHKLYGQSKKIPEKDKKTWERFLSEQIQAERNRHQMVLRQLEETHETQDMSREATSDGFTKREIKEELYSIHTQLEPVVLKEMRDCDLDANHDANSIGGDDDGHPDYRSERGRQDRAGRRESTKFYIEDMDFTLIHEDINTVMAQIERLNGTINDCMRHFECDDEDHSSFPLAAHVGELVARRNYLENVSSEDRKHIKELLDRNEGQYDKIARLESECEGYIKQNQAIMSGICQKTRDIQELRSELAAIKQKQQKQIQQQQQQQQQQHPDRRGNSLFGYVSKPTTTTPRGGGAGDTNGPIAGRPKRGAAFQRKDLHRVGKRDE